MVDDKLVVAGGRRSGYGGDGFETTSKETNDYDFDTGEWTELPSPEGDIPTERAGIVAAIHQCQGSDHWWKKRQSATSS